MSVRGAGGEVVGVEAKRRTLRIQTRDEPTMKGYLEKKRKFGWHKRYFVLEKSIISYYESSSTDSFPLGTYPPSPPFLFLYLFHTSFF